MVKVTKQIRAESRPERSQFCHLHPTLSLSAQEGRITGLGAGRGLRPGWIRVYAPG